MTRAQEIALEAAIEARRQELIAAPTPEKQRDAWYSMKALIEARSPMAVMRMEAQRGLRRTS